MGHVPSSIVAKGSKEGDSGSVHPGTKSSSQDCPYFVQRGCERGEMRGHQRRDDYNHNRYEENDDVFIIYEWESLIECENHFTPSTRWREGLLGRLILSTKKGAFIGRAGGGFLGRTVEKEVP